MSGQHSYEELLQKDLKLIWTILHYIHHPPKKYARLIKWVQQNILDKVISKHPWRDITAVIWIFFAVGMVELRFPHFWVVTMNLGLCCGNTHFPPFLLFYWAYPEFYLTTNTLSDATHSCSKETSGV